VIYYNFGWIFAFSALTLLVGCQEEHPACKNWATRCRCGYLSAVRCRLFACGPTDATSITKPHHLLPHLNPDWFYLSGTSLRRLSWKKRLLNRCRSSSTIVDGIQLTCVFCTVYYNTHWQLLLWNSTTVLNSDSVQAKNISLLPGFISFLCSLAHCLAPEPLKLWPYGTIQICSSVHYYYYCAQNNLW